MSPAELAELHARCLTVPRPWRAHEFTALLSNPAIVFVTADQGFALGRCALDEAELLTIAVAPTHRRAGVGMGLLRRFERDALSRGAATAFLEVAAGNAPARALYARAGYGPTGRRAGYYRLPGGRFDDALILSRRLQK